MHHCKWFWIRQVLSARFFQDLLSIQQLLLRTNESLWAHLKVWPILLQITDRESRFPKNHWMMPAGQLWKSAICVREVCRKHFHLLHRMQTSGLAQWYPGVTSPALWRGTSDAAWFLGAQIIYFSMWNSKITFWKIYVTSCYQKQVLVACLQNHLCALLIYSFWCTQVQILKTMLSCNYVGPSEPSVCLFYQSASVLFFFFKEKKPASFFILLL